MTWAETEAALSDVLLPCLWAIVLIAGGGYLVIHFSQRKRGAGAGAFLVAFTALVPYEGDPYQNGQDLQ